MTNPETPCKLCGGKSTYRFSLPLLAGLRGEYFECSNCGLLQSHHLDSLTPFDLGKIANYPPNVDFDSGAAWRLSCIANRVEQLVKLRLMPRANRNFKALDFGSGTGFLVSYLAHRFGWITVGYDPYCGPAFGQGKVFTEWEAIVQRGPYDLIVASEVFEHFTNPREDLIRIRDVLAKDAAFVYVTTGLYIPGVTDSNWSYLAPQSGHHVSFYARQTMKEIARLMGANGVYQAGADYEWLFVFGKSCNLWLKKANLAVASALLGWGTRLGIISAIE